MIPFYRTKPCVFLICLFISVSLSKGYSTFYSNVEERYDYDDIGHNMDYNKDLLVNRSNKANVSITLPTVKKLKIGRISGKQYEIVNVLWRKTKIFLDLDTTTLQKEISATNERSFTTNPRMSNQNKNQISVSTPSCIEFYYSDKLGDQVQLKDTIVQKTGKENTDMKLEQDLQRDILSTSKSKVLRRPMFSFHVNNRNLNEEVNSDSENFYLNLNENLKKLQNLQSNDSKIRLMNTSENISNKRIVRNNNNDSQWLSIFFNDPLNRLDVPSKGEISLESTTIYDKIKFFEIYDNNTLATRTFKNQDESSPTQRDDTFPHDISVNRTQAIKSWNNHSAETYTTSSVYNSETFIIAPKSIVNRKRNIFKRLHENYQTRSLETKRLNETNPTTIFNTETPMVWAKYPYLSVYIYEPMSIYCDTAAITTHWLIASGSCLSRHRKTVLAHERSAYITYCGDKWWEHRSIVYVRRTLVHPLYNRRNKIRRHHYNIGAVQVINPMINSCFGWAPISLVSHNFTINEKGFPATAIGWGLDRYNSRYSYFDLPRRTLVAYEGIIFPKSCPKATENVNSVYEEALNVKNIYCLSLPYKGEKKDTSHGSLLLVQGKLMALALQETKSHGSEISVLYTGIWRLVPWIKDITRNSTRESSDKNLA